MHQSYIGRQNNYIKGFGFSYNLVAIYYTNSKFILNNKIWFIYCIYIYKGKVKRNAESFRYMRTFLHNLAQINIKSKACRPVQNISERDLLSGPGKKNN